MGTSLAAGAALAVAVAVKPVVLPVAAPLAWRLAAARRWRELTAAAAGTVAALVALYLPFVLMEGGVARMGETARVFTDLWGWNASLHASAVWAWGDKVIADRVCAWLLALCLIVATVRSRDAITAAMAFFFAALLLSSTAHPWYLLWALVLLPLRPGAWFAPALWVLSLTIAWSYAAVFRSNFKPPGWVVWAQYVPVYAALAASAVAGVWRWRDKR